MLGRLADVKRELSDPLFSAFSVLEQHLFRLGYLFFFMEMLYVFTSSSSWYLKKEGVMSSLKKHRATEPEKEL